MAADLERELIERYNLGLFAEWAGDLSYASAALGDVGSRSAKDLLTSSVDAIRLAAEARLRRILQHQERIPGQVPITIETVHLHGVIHRIGHWEFEMRAFLRDFSWENDFFRAANRIIQQRGFDPHNLPAEDRLRDLVPGEYPTRQDLPIAKSFGGTWVLDQEPFPAFVTVSEFGLIRARSSILSVDRDDLAEVVVQGFKNVLEEIDPAPQPEPPLL